ncbi:MAG: hypothetical protein M3252_06130 [Actinomycetota bacterium]|nr:hypothetical protein [Actinomycetota bacterium]
MPPTSLGISTRLYFVVLETTLDGLVTVPRRRRYLRLLAGMLADLVAAAAFTMAAAALGPDEDLSLVGRVCLAVAFSTLVRLAWQLCLPLRTDLCQLASTLARCLDLHTTTRQLLANRANRLLGRHHRLVNENDWHPRDRRAARWYAPLLVAGYLAWQPPWPGGNATPCRTTPEPSTGRALPMAAVPGSTATTQQPLAPLLRGSGTDVTSRLRRRGGTRA